MTEFRHRPAAADPTTLIINGRSEHDLVHHAERQQGREPPDQDGLDQGVSLVGRALRLALDRAGNVWFCRMGDSKMGRLDPTSGQIAEVDMGRDSLPRRRRRRTGRDAVDRALTVTASWRSSIPSP